MATLQNIIVFVFVLTFTLMLGYSADYATSYGFVTGTGTAAQNQFARLNASARDLSESVSTLVNQPSWQTLFPNVFGIFASAFSILASIVTAPYTVLTALDLPEPIQTGFAVIVLVLGIYLAVTWQKGQTS